MVFTDEITSEWAPLGVQDGSCTGGSPPAPPPTDAACCPCGGQEWEEGAPPEVPGAGGCRMVRVGRGERGF